MNKKTHLWAKIALFSIGSLAATALLGPALAATDQERIAELERKVGILTEEVQQERYSDLFTEVGSSQYGMGPAASKVYTKEQGVTIGGYGEGLYQVKEDATDEADFLRAVLYFGYKYNEKWVFNSEIEIEHATTSEEGSTSVEFAYLDYLHATPLNFRAGLLLIPVGLVNELHEPNVFLSANRPETEQRIIPSTWRENGMGLFGSLGEHVSYKAYVVNGLEGEDFNGKGLRGGRQKGSKASAEDLAGVVRVDVTPTEGLVIGASAYLGESGQDLGVELQTELYEAHLDWNYRGLHARALGTIARLDNVAELNRIKATSSSPDGITPLDSDIDSVGEEMVGWYVECGYDVLNTLDVGEASLTPFVRYEEVDTQSKVPSGFATSSANDIEVVTVGLNFKPLDEIVFKADYQFIDHSDGSGSDQANLAMGYVF